MEEEALHPAAAQAQLLLREQNRQLVAKARGGGALQMRGLCMRPRVR
jgi:hypothetical protein